MCLRLVGCYKIGRKFLQLEHVDLGTFICDYLAGSQRGVPGVLEPWNFCFGARSLIILLTGALILFWLWSLEPKEIFCGAQSPAFLNLIIRDPRLHWFLFIDCFSVCLCVLTAIKKQNLKRGQYITNTSIRDYLKLIMICNNLFDAFMKTLL